jgi:hypothetical protein
LAIGGPRRLENLEKAINAAGYGALLDDKSTLAQRLEAFEKIINSVARRWPRTPMAATAKSAPISTSSPVRNARPRPQRRIGPQ